ncbi:MAG: EMC3/TMCO1 family protein [Candidatus Woesearchaeota archaeon]
MDVLGLLFGLPLTLTVAVIAFMLSLLVVLVYKFATDQTKMKSLKEDLKQLQDKLKAAKKPEQMMRLQKEMMNKNMDYMMQSFKPTLITFIPIVLIFGYLNAHLGYMPLMPGSEFRVAAVFAPGTTGSIALAAEGVELVSEPNQTIAEGRAVWVMKADAGDYVLQLTYDGESYKKDIIVTDEHRYTNPVKNIEQSKLKTIRVSNEKLIVLDLLGWKIGWLGSYILFSLVFSVVLRKILNVH